MKHATSIVAALVLVLFGHAPRSENRAWAQIGSCSGDCNHDARVSVNELVTGVNMALGTMPISECPDIDPDGSHSVSVAELVGAVNNALGGCEEHPNRAPEASNLSFVADASTPYVEGQLIGRDPDNDTITYELVGEESGDGYGFAYVNPDTGGLYLSIAENFAGTISLQYRVTDGKLFSANATVTIEVQDGIPSRQGGALPVDAKRYASYPRGFYTGSLQGAPGLDPWLPTAVDLSGDFPLPGDQGNQYSCVGWSLGYAIKSYQERVELGWSLEPASHRFSPAYIYNQLNGGRDHGLIYEEALNFVVDQGVASLASMPYDDQDFWTQPSLAAQQEAAQFKVQSWDTANGILEIKQALANHLPVMLIVHQFQDLNLLRGADSVYNTFVRDWLGQHAVTAVGYDDNRYGGSLRVMNSWGQGWGDGGYFWLPYSAATTTVYAADGPSPVLIGAVVVHDAADPGNPDTDPVDPPTGDGPDLQATNWYASFDGRPGGSGSLQYTVTNTGASTAPQGAYVALVLSTDPTFKSNTTLVVYEQIPFDMAPGTTVYRDANNTIAFNFPSNLAPGKYYMALWADMWDAINEWNENDNISPTTGMIDIVNTLPDEQIVTWYADWDEIGHGSLTYEVINNGGAVAPAGWNITLALSPNDTFGDGDETILFSEAANFDSQPGGTIYRDDGSAAGFSIYFDASGNEVPDGTYYIALWLDPNNSLAESNEYNNASLSWGTVDLGQSWLAANSVLGNPETSAAGRKAYNGRVLPPRRSVMSKVHISTMSEGLRRMDVLAHTAAVDDDGPSMKAGDVPRPSKEARARQQVIHPVAEMIAMPPAQ